MTDLNTLATQLKSAAKSLIDEIAKIDSEYKILEERRHLITSGSISKADYLDYVKVHFEIKANRFKSDLIKNIKQSSFDFGSNERKLKNNEYHFGCLFLTPYNVPVEITENALYFYFSDIFIARIDEALDEIEWPNDCMPKEQRREELLKIEATMNDLMKQREAIVKSLDEAGLER